MTNSADFMYPALLAKNMSGNSAGKQASQYDACFGLTIFSIAVFGLAPTNGRYLRHVSWHGYLFLALAWVLVLERV